MKELEELKEAMDEQGGIQNAQVMMGGVKGAGPKLINNRHFKPIIYTHKFPNDVSTLQESLI